jgi:hypothetical protein
MAVRITLRMRPQDHPDEDGLPDWLDPIYDEDDPRDFMQVLSSDPDSIPPRACPRRSATEAYIIAPPAMVAAPVLLRFVFCAFIDPGA